MESQAELDVVAAAVLVVVGGFSAKGPQERERQHIFGVGSEDLEGRERTSKDVSSRRIEPVAPPRPVFDFPRPLFAKATQLACGDVKEIGVRIQQRNVTMQLTVCTVTPVFFKRTF